MSLLNTLWLQISSSHQSTTLSHHRHRSFYQNCEALSDMFTQLSPRACGLLLLGLRFWLGSCALLILDFLPCCRKALWRLQLCLSLQSRCIPLLLSCRRSIWGHLKPQLLSWSQSVTMKLTLGCFPITTVSWRLGASLCLRNNSLGLCVFEKGWESKASVRTIWCFCWALWVEHMEALRKESALFSDPGLMKGVLQICIPPSRWPGTQGSFYWWVPWIKPGPSSLTVSSINWVMWETLQVRLWEEGGLGTTVPALRDEVKRKEWADV